MAEPTTFEPGSPGDWQTDEDMPPTEPLPVAAPEGSFLDDLAKLRERRESEQEKELALPRFDGYLWARYHLLGPKRNMQIMRAVADDSAPDGQITATCAKFIADATIEVYAKRDGKRIPVPGCEPEGAKWLDLPPELVPPRPAGKQHDPATAVRAAINHDTMLCGHALDLATWMQGAQQEVAEGFVGESDGDPK